MAETTYTYDVAADFPGIGPSQAQERLGEGPGIFLLDSSMIPNRSSDGTNAGNQLLVVGGVSPPPNFLHFFFLPQVAQPEYDAY